MCHYSLHQTLKEHPMCGVKRTSLDLEDGIIGRKPNVSGRKARGRSRKPLNLTANIFDDKLRTIGNFGSKTRKTSNSCSITRSARSIFAIRAVTKQVFRGYNPDYFATREIGCSILFSNAKHG